MIVVFLGHLFRASPPAKGSNRVILSKIPPPPKDIYSMTLEHEQTQNIHTSYNWRYSATSTGWFSLQYHLQLHRYKRVSVGGKNPKLYLMLQTLFYAVFLLYLYFRYLWWMICNLMYLMWLILQCIY